MKMVNEQMTMSQYYQIITPLKEQRDRLNQQRSIALKENHHIAISEYLIFSTHDDFLYSVNVLRISDMLKDEIQQAGNLFFENFSLLCIDLFFDPYLLDFRKICKKKGLSDDQIKSYCDKIKFAIKYKNSLQ